jgi:hypothetical protein
MVNIYLIFNGGGLHIIGRFVAKPSQACASSHGYGVDTRFALHQQRLLEVIAWRFEV